MFACFSRLFGCFDYLLVFLLVIVLFTLLCWLLYLEFVYLGFVVSWFYWFGLIVLVVFGLCWGWVNLVELCVLGNSVVCFALRFTLSYRIGYLFLVVLLVWLVVMGCLFVFVVGYFVLLSVLLLGIRLIWVEVLLLTVVCLFSIWI